jgi:hypothetical protein
MGGQACVFYGVAEFRRDCDIVIAEDDENFQRLQNALDDLNAECIAVPPLDWSHLNRGHAIHFRCQHPEDLRRHHFVSTFVFRSGSNLPSAF